MSHHTYRSVLFTICFLILTLIGCQPAEKTSKLQLQPDPAGIIRVAADRVLMDFSAPPEFNWGEGVLMTGMVRAGRAVQEERYLAFVRRWTEYWRERGLKTVLEEKGYCGRWGPAYAVLELNGVMEEDRYLTMAHDVVSYFLREGTRTSDGAFGHWRGNRQLWVDTLYMVCPLLADLGEEMDREEFKAEASRQLVIFAKHLQDDQTGLFYHMYDEPGQTRTDAFWGRGNGWAAMSLVEVLEQLEPDAEPYTDLAPILRHQAEGLLATWDGETGLWHTVLDRHDSYIETSASAMILYSLVRAERLGVIEPLDPEMVSQSWTALAGQIDVDGRVINVSTGTGPASYEEYATIPVGTYTWGTGAFLILAAELHADSS